MEPALVPGDRLLAVRHLRLRVGDIVVVSDPRQPQRRLVKRVAAREGASLTVTGDNSAASTDSLTFGPVPARSVHGRVIYRYAPEGRRGALR